MGMGQQQGWAAWALVGLLWTPGAVAQVPPGESVILAQTSPITITGQLDDNSDTLESGRRITLHRIQGNAGDVVTLELSTDGFEAMLLLYDPETGEFLGQAVGTTARLRATLPRTDSYSILVLGADAEEIGTYRLQWQSNTAIPEQSDALQRARDLNQQATALYEAGRYQDAEPLYQQALAIRRQQLGEDHPDVAASLNNLALLYTDQGRYREAEPLYQQALAILREQFGQNHPDVATSLNNLAGLYIDQGRYREAEPLYQESLAIRREQLGQSHPDVAASLNNLASLYRVQGRYREAESLYRESLAILREQLGQNHPDVATSLNNLAVLYSNQGRYGEAEPLYQQALAIRRQQLGEDHPDVATSLNNLAGLYRDQGRYREAEPLYQQALAILREQLGQNHPDVATSLNNLAVLYSNQGRYGEAEPLYQQALAIRRQQLGEDHPTVAASLDNLASLYRVQGRYGEAEPLHQQALAIRRQQLGENHPDVATSLNNLAELYRVQGRYGEAEPLYQQALAILREQLGEDNPDVATSLNNLAVLYQVQGRYGEAKPLYQQALAIWRQQLGENHPDVAISLNNLAVLHQAQGNTAQAVRSLQTGLAIEEGHLDLNLTTLTEAQRQDYAATLSGTTNGVISLSLEAPEAVELALTTLLRRKGRILDAGTSSRQVLRQNLTSEDQAILDQLTDIQRQLATLTFNPPPSLPPDQYRARLEELEAEASQLENTLARRSAAFRAETQPIEVAAVAAQLPTNGVLVEYVRYQPFNAQDPQNPWGADRYAAYLLFPNGRIEAVDLGPAAEVDAAARDFIGLLQDRSATLRAIARPERLVQDVQAVTGKMQALILDPIAPYLSDSDHLLISPDSQLNLIPFEALQSEAGGPFLIEQYQISYLNSGRDLLKFNVTEPSRAPAVVLANPDYEQGEPGSGGAGELGVDSNQSASELAQIQVGPLPGTAAEAEAIRPLLPNAQILTEEDATENALKQVQAPRILHIATHGFFLTNVERPDPNSRGLGLRAFGDSLAPLPGFTIENPLLRSGLALAGFNPRRSGGEDGVFTALEASQLNLFGTQLVVLSACDTGLGQVANGEGVYGLRRAFAIAGAESQLLSLWQVDDFGTQSLMARYYENLTAGMGRSEALRQVQLEMIAADDTYSHPYYWAAFILAGDWRSLD
jgi:CHAT domain-containing protein